VPPNSLVGTEAVSKDNRLIALPLHVYVIALQDTCFHISNLLPLDNVSDRSSLVDNKNAIAKS
jgi:hypothetical protein